MPSDPESPGLCKELPKKGNRGPRPQTTVMDLSGGAESPASASFTSDKIRKPSKGAPAIHGAAWRT
jgi:hypothetical protein